LRAFWRPLYALLRWGGVLYLFWLAFETWTGRDGHPSNTQINDGQDWRYFRRGLLTNLLNPKAAMFYIAVLPLFADPADPALRQTIALTVAYALIATAVHAAIVILAATARPLLENQASMTTVRRVLAVALAAIALWVLWSTRVQGPG
jgi:threonine/homoserine/homoserine lactone efflux protein